MRIDIPVAALCVWMILGVQGTEKQRQLSGQKYAVTSATEPISGVALVTWVSKPGQPNELDLAVVWRGRPGWFMEGQRFSTSGGGTSTSFQQTVTYADISLSFRFVSSTRQLVLLDSTPIDLKDANVVLVDNVTDLKKAGVVSKLTVPSKLTGPGELIEPFGKSNEIFAFLQCDAEVPKISARPAVEVLCRDLRAANKGK